MEEYVADYEPTVPLERGFLTDIQSSPPPSANQTDVWCGVADPVTDEAIHVLEEIKYYIQAYINPAVCMFGVVGNIFNLLVLTRRRLQCSMDSTMERAAHLGLISLAVSDMLYCLVTLPTAFISRSQTLYRNIFLVFIQMYSVCFQNIFVHTSIWLTVILAVGRYAAICRPIQARYLVGVNPTRVAVCLTFVLWSLLEIPRFWTFHREPLPCVTASGATYWVYLIDQGLFVQNKLLKTSFDYISSILGFCIPILILVYCNIHLIKALRKSSRVRQLCRVHPKLTTHGSYITPTLVAIVCMLIFLISPSEILHFFFFQKVSDPETLLFAIVVAKLMQNFNFSCNFVLYCLVNVHFRETWKSLVYCKSCRRRYSHVRRGDTKTSIIHHPLTTKGSTLVQSSFESVI